MKNNIIIQIYHIKRGTTQRYIRVFDGVNGIETIKCIKMWKWNKKWISTFFQALLLIISIYQWYRV